MQDNQTKTLYSVTRWEWAIDRPPKKWTVEKETDKTFTVHDADLDVTPRRTIPKTQIRKATMEAYDDVFVFSYDEAIEKQKEIIKGKIEAKRGRIVEAEKDIARLEQIYADIVGGTNPDPKAN